MTSKCERFRTNRLTLLLAFVRHLLAWEIGIGWERKRKIGTREKIQLWDFSSCTVFRIARSNPRRRCRRDWISIMRRGFFLVAGDATLGPEDPSTILSRTIPFLSIHGCESLNLFLQLFWSISGRFLRLSLDGRKNLVKGIRLLRRFLCFSKMDVFRRWKY